MSSHHSAVICQPSAVRCQGKALLGRIAIVLGLVVLVGGYAVGPESYAGEFGPKKSISSALQSGAAKVSKMLTPSMPVKKARDPLSLSTKSKLSAELYVAMARMAEQSGKPVEAQRQYEQALKLEPDRLDTLLGYAHFTDRQGQLNEATRVYQRAARMHPHEAAVFNDLGLCFARRNMLNESLAAIERAIQLQPDRRLYRNNIATVLVEMGDVDRAFSHLKAVHSEAVTYYNLAYLMQKNGQEKAAARLFAEALNKNPAFVEAQVWLNKLGGWPPSDSRPASPSGTGRTAPQYQATLPSQSTSSPPALPRIGRSRKHRSGVRQFPPVLKHLPNARSLLPSPMVEPEPPKNPPLPRQTPVTGGTAKPANRPESAPLPTGRSVNRGNAGGPAPDSKPDMPVVQPLPPVDDDSP